MNWALTLSLFAVKIFYIFKIQNQQNLSAETGVLRCYGRQRATNLYYSGSREQIVNERRRDSNAEMFAMVHRDQKARRRRVIFFYPTWGVCRGKSRNSSVAWDEPAPKDTPR